jgi:hypothetical protein
MALARAALLALVAAAPLVAVAGAQGGWAISGHGTANAGAGSMPGGPKPAASVSAGQVALTWSAVTAGGAAVDGYLVRRYSEAGALQTIGAACSGTIASTACTEASVPTGRWAYTTQAVKSAWKGAESARSRTVEIAAAPSAVSCANCTTFGATVYINAATRLSVSVQVTLPASSLATDTVHLTLTDSVGTVVTAATQAATAGAGSVTFSGLSTATLVDGTVTATAWVTANTGDSSPTASATLVRDIVAPGASDISGANGGTAGKLDTSGDSLTYTFSEPMAPASIRSGWSGSSVTVTATVVAGDTITISGVGALGSVSTGGAGYVLSVPLVGNTVSCPSSTMVMSGSTITVTLGGCGPFTLINPLGSGSTTFSWTPSSSATDRAGNPMSTTVRSEVGGPKANF